jgi:hypothetical protein
LDDIKPPKEKDTESGMYMNRTADDNFTLHGSSINPQPLVTLAMVRRLRRAHEKRRIDDLKNIRIRKRIYRKQVVPLGGTHL